MLPENSSKIYTVSFDPRLQDKIDRLRLKLKSSSKQILLESNQLGFTSLEIAPLILQELKMTDVEVHITEEEENFYNSFYNYIGLSESIATSQSVMAVAIMAHEIGHALQFRADRKINNFLGREHIIWFRLFHNDFLQLRLMVLPMIALMGIKHVKLVSFSLPSTYFNTTQIIALTPLFICYEFFYRATVIYDELNASVRAIHLLKYYKILSKQQLKVAQKFLMAAAMTYIIKR
jgi:uncharacterized protein